MKGEFRYAIKPLSEGSLMSFGDIRGEFISKIG
jgi:hypothetical protein